MSYTTVMLSSKSTKIVATIGPATDSKEMLTKLVDAGMNVARFNTKHSDPAWHNERIKIVREISAEKKVPLGVLVDLQGPEIRIDLADEGSFQVEDDEEVLFTSDRSQTGEKIAYIPHDVIHSISVDSLIMLDDGICEFLVTKVDDKSVWAKAVEACTVKHRKTLNTPGTILDIPAITDRDLAYLDEIDPSDIDFVALSFVRDVDDIEQLQAELDKRNFKSKIVAKIENQAALDNIEKIVQVSDVIMIARGDLGVEVDFAQLTYWQKLIINECRDEAKPVITATQMLESMIENPRPTRAEVSDVAHAIYDGTDAVMLSGETTIGKYPAEAVKVQTEIAEFNEAYTHHDMRWPKNTSSSLNITSNAANMLMRSDQQIDKVVCLTETGYTARLLSRFRPKQPIIAITDRESTYRELSVVYGVTPIFMPFPNGEIAANKHYTSLLESDGVIQKGETVLMVHGTIWKMPGLTNTMTLVKVE